MPETSSLDFEEINRVTKFAVGKYRISIPKNMTLDEFCHEVCIYMLTSCKLKNPGASAIIKNVRWTSAKLFRRQKSTGEAYYAKKNKQYFNADDIDNKDEVEWLLSLSFTGRDREILENLASGLDNTEIYAKIGLSRQNYHIYKKFLFERLRLILLEKEEV